MYTCQNPHDQHPKHYSQHKNTRPYQKDSPSQQYNLTDSRENNPLVPTANLVLITTGMAHHRNMRKSNTPSQALIMLRVPKANSTGESPGVARANSMEENKAKVNTTRESPGVAKVNSMVGENKENPTTTSHTTTDADRSLYCE